MAIFDYKQLLLYQLINIHNCTFQKNDCDFHWEFQRFYSSTASSASKNLDALTQI